MSSSRFNIHRISLDAVLVAIAVVISIIEGLIPSIGIPGVKLGLANIVILVCLYELGVLDAIIVNILRVFLAGVLRGNIFSMGFVMSLTGAAFSLIVIIVLYKLVKGLSIIGISVVGAIFHVTGQILIAMIYLDTAYIWYYLPVISLSAIITGILTGIGARLIIKTGIIKKVNNSYQEE